MTPTRDDGIRVIQEAIEEHERSIHHDYPCAERVFNHLRAAGWLAVYETRPVSVLGADTPATKEDANK